MGPGTYVYVTIALMFWILTVNVIKYYLQREAYDNDTYSYYIRMRPTSYHDRTIYGELANDSQDPCSFADHSGEWESFIKENIGSLVELHYDVTYSGILFLSIGVRIEDIVSCE